MIIKTCQNIDKSRRTKFVLPMPNDFENPSNLFSFLIDAI